MTRRGSEEEQRISETWNVEKKSRAANAWLSSCRLMAQIAVVFTFMVCSVFSLFSLFFLFFFFFFPPFSFISLYPSVHSGKCT